MSTSARVTLIPGDGIGPEVTEAAVRVVEAAGRRRSSGSASRPAAEVVAKYGTAVPEGGAELDPQERGRAQGADRHARSATGFRSANVTLRQALDLYACVRPVRSIPGVADALRGRRPGHRAREHRGPLLGPRAPGRAGRRREPQGHDRARLHADRAVRLRAAREREGRRKVTAVHKANIMKLTDGLFLECARRVAREFTATIALRRDHRRQLRACSSCAIPTQFDVLRAREPLRRHPLRPLRGPRRRARRRAGREHRRATARSSRRCTAPRPTSPARASRTRRR